MINIEPVLVVKQEDTTAAVETRNLIEVLLPPPVPLEAYRTKNCINRFVLSFSPLFFSVLIDSTLLATAGRPVHKVIMYQFTNGAH